MRRHRLYHIALLATFLLALPTQSAPSVSLLLEARGAAFRACRWLADNQRENGSWNDNTRLTAQAITALSRSGYGESESIAPALNRALLWLEKAPEYSAANPTIWEQRSDRANALAAAESAKAELPPAVANWRTMMLEQALETQRGEGCWQEGDQNSLAATIHALLVIGIAGGDELRQTGERE
jgi:hypothetical protein